MVNFPSVGTKTEDYMKMAYAEVARVWGNTLPNPPVGAILVNRRKIVGTGGTSPAGGPHAEINAIQNAGTRSKGSTLFVTLEPCCHFGRTPPCVNAIIAAGIKKVYISAIDPNPVVHKKGVSLLEKAGIKVITGILPEMARQTYTGYHFWVKHQRPKVILKMAQSIDGAINAKPGTETAITGPETKRWSHQIRATVNAVVIGGETARVDDPDLTPRLLPHPHPCPDAVIISRTGHFPTSLKLFKTTRVRKSFVLSNQWPNLPDHIRCHKIPARKQPIPAALDFFRKMNYHSVLVEGGAQIIQHWLKYGGWDEFHLFTGSKFFPEGDKWARNLPKNWDKSIIFDKFLAVGGDSLLTICPKHPG